MPFCRHALSFSSGGLEHSTVAVHLCFFSFDGDLVISSLLIFLRSFWYSFYGFQKNLPSTITSSLEGYFQSLSALPIRKHAPSVSSGDGEHFFMVVSPFSSAFKVVWWFQDSSTWSLSLRHSILKHSCCDSSHFDLIARYCYVLCFKSSPFCVGCTYSSVNI